MCRGRIWILPVTLTALRSEEIQQGEEELLTTERLNVAGYEIGISLANCRCKGTERPVTQRTFFPRAVAAKV